MTTAAKPSLRRMLLEFAARGGPGDPVRLFDRPDDRFGPSALRSEFANFPPADVFQMMHWLVVDDRLVRAVDCSSNDGPYWVIRGLTANGARALEEADQPAKKKGRPTKAVPPEIAAEAMAWIAAEGVSDQKAVEDKLLELFAAVDREPSQSTIWRWSKRLLEIYSRAVSDVV